MSKVFTVVLLAITPFITASCGMQARASLPEVATPPPTFASPTLGLLSKSIVAMETVKSYHFVRIGKEFKNWETFMDGTTPRYRIEGDFVFPDRERFVNMSKGTDDLEVIRVGDEILHRWGNSDVYNETPPGFFDNGTPSQSIMNIMKAAEEATIMQHEVVEGVSTIHVSFLYDGKHGGKLEFPAHFTGLKETPAHVWIEEETNRVRKYEIFRPGEEGAYVSVTFSKFDEPVLPSIKLPANP